MSLIAAVYGAVFAAQRLVQPVQDLIAGTRAVAKGNYDTKLPLPGRDELGFLVTSFNDMTSAWAAHAKKPGAASRRWSGAGRGLR